MNIATSNTGCVKGAFLLKVSKFADQYNSCLVLTSGKASR
jgi:hypothetical protein